MLKIAEKSLNIGQSYFNLFRFFFIKLHRTLPFSKIVSNLDTGCDCNEDSVCCSKYRISWRTRWNMRIRRRRFRSHTFVVFEGYSMDSDFSRQNLWKEDLSIRSKQKVKATCHFFFFFLCMETWLIPHCIASLQDIKHLVH